MLSIDKIIEIAKKEGTPLYIWDKDGLANRIQTMRQILGDDVDIAYAMKANPFLVDAMKGLDTKFEVCSPGEFAICEREKVDMKSIVLSGVNKERADVEHTFDDCGCVGIYTIESLDQYALIDDVASSRQKKVEILLRVTSGNQFGMDQETIEDIVKDRAKHPYTEIIGIQCYSGTQKKKMDIIAKELDWLDSILKDLKEKYAFEAKELEYGPGLSIEYFGDAAYENNYDSLKEFAALLEEKGLKKKYHLTFEMGRYIAALSGIYVTSIADIKSNAGIKYCVADGGINHVNYYGQALAMKVPAYDYVDGSGKVYNGRKLLAVRDGQEAKAKEAKKAGLDFTEDLSLDGISLESCTIVGSLCTVADVLVKNLPIPAPKKDDMIVFYNIGAYSVTEGIYLFLSRKMPKISAYSEEGGLEIYRDFKNSYEINSRQEV